MIEAIIFAILAAVLGLVMVFFGYALFRILLPIWAFFAGLTFGINAMDALMGNGFFSASLGLIIGLIAGLIFAAIAYFAYQLAVVLWGASIGYLLGAGLMLAIGFNQGFIPWLVGVVLAVIMAVLFMNARMPRFLIMLFTAGAGAMVLISGLFVLFGQVPAFQNSVFWTRFQVYDSWFWIIVWALIAGFGIAVQATMARGADLMQAAEWDELMGRMEAETA